MSDQQVDAEDQYFAAEDLEKLRRIALEQKAKLAEEERAALKALHHMKCPKCGMDLQTLKQGNVELDSCFNCHGVWLDAGELEQLIKQHGHEGSQRVMGSILNLFKRSPPSP